LKAFAQLRRSYSIALGLFALALPFFALSIDSTAAPPKGFGRKTDLVDPATAVVNADDAEAQGDDADPMDQHRNLKLTLNYVSASWSKVLQDFASATQTELVADHVPTTKYSRWDWKAHSRDEALKILNKELEPQNFRLQFKGNYLVLNQLKEFRHEYAPAVLRGELNDADKAASHADDATSGGGERSEKPAAGKAQSKKLSGRQSGRRDSIRQVSGEGGESSAARDGTEPQPAPILTTVQLKSRDAVKVSKVIYNSFKSQAELIDEGPRGLQGFLVRRPDRKGAKGAPAGRGGSSLLRFAVGIDMNKNQLVLEASPDETRSVVKLIKTIDSVPKNSKGTTVRAVATTKDADKVAATLQPQLNRLVSATRKTARQIAQRTEEGNDDDQADAESEDEDAMPRRPAPRRRGSREDRDNGEQPGTAQELLGSLRGEVTVESVPEVGVLVIKGNEKDVEAVMTVIREIERLSAGTAPEVRVVFLRHVSSEALASLLTAVYEKLGAARNATVQQSQAVSVFPVSRPNAILIVASKVDMPHVFELVEDLDQPSDPATEFEVFRLKHAVPSKVVDDVEALYPPAQQQQGQANQPQGAVGLVPRVRIIDDLRTNSVIVQARPRDMREIALLIGELDAKDTDSVHQIKIFPLNYAVADEVSATLSQAIQAVLSPARATTAAAAGGAQGGQFGGQQAAQGGGQAASELREVKSSILQFLDEDTDQGREIRSGILADIRMNPDLRTNSIVVTAPPESMELVAALIKRLDRPAAAVAEIKVFKVKSGDATSMQQLLERLFGIQRTGQPGQQGAQGGQQGVPGLLLTDAEDSSSMLIPLRFSVDIRTNSIIAIGGASALAVVEAVILTLDESEIRQRENKVYRLKNTPADVVAQAITNFLQTQRQVQTTESGLISPFEQIEREVIVVAEPTSNSLLISATPRYFDEIYKLVLELDRTPKQVLIQALIVEVTLNNTDEWGMELGLQDSILFKRSALTGNPIFQNVTNTLGTGLQTTTQNILSESAVPGYLFNSPTTQALGNNTSPGINAQTIGGQAASGFNTGLTNSTLGYGGLVLQAGSENVNFLLRALAARTRVDVLSRPQVRAVDNQLAVVQVGSEIPRINGFTPSGTAGVITPTVQQRSIGIILQVTPRISPDGLIIMQIVARRDSLSQNSVSLGFSAAGTTISSPIINTTNAQTTIAVNSGQTAILGGMITKQDSVEERKVPVLGDIPIIGRAFRYDFKNMQRSELLIFLTPRLVHSDEESEMFKQIEIERLNFIESEAERMHGPLYGLPPEPGSSAPDSAKPVAPPMKGKRVPAPPEPKLPGAPPIPDDEPIPEPLENGTGASLMRSDDDEDLDSAFIQTDYRVPQSKTDAPGRARLAKTDDKPSAPSVKKKKTKGTAKPKSAAAEKNQSPVVRRVLEEP